MTCIYEKMLLPSLAVCLSFFISQVAPRDAFYRHLWDEVPFFEVRRGKGEEQEKKLKTGEREKGEKMRTKNKTKTTAVA